MQTKYHGIMEFNLVWYLMKLAIIFFHWSKFRYLFIALSNYNFAFLFYFTYLLTIFSPISAQSRKLLKYNIYPPVTLLKKTLDDNESKHLYAAVLGMNGFSLNSICWEKRVPLFQKLHIFSTTFNRTRALFILVVKFQWSLWKLSYESTFCYNIV